MTDPKTKSLLRARAAEQEGKPAEAVELFKAAGQVEEAARVLAQQGKPTEAARLLIGSLGVRPSQVGQLDLGLKKRALKAAIQLAKAGETTQAVEIFLALGEKARAVQALEKAGDHLGAEKLGSSPGLMKPASQRAPPAAAPSAAAPAGSAADSPVLAHKLESTGKGEQALEMWSRLKRFGDAARVAKALGRHADAAQLYADAGLHYDAALTFRALGDGGRCLDHLLQVQRGDPRYRQAAIETIQHCAEQDLMPPSLEQLLSAFVRSGPQSEKELEVFDELSRLYLRHDLAANAREALEKMVERSPKWRDAARRLQALSREARESSRGRVPSAAEAAPRAGVFSGNPMDDLPALPAVQAPGSAGDASSLFFGEVPQPFEELEPLEPIDPTESEAPEAGAAAGPLEAGDDLELIPLDEHSAPPPAATPAPAPAAAAPAAAPTPAAPAPARAPAAAGAGGGGAAAAGAAAAPGSPAAGTPAAAGAAATAAAAVAAAAALLARPGGQHRPSAGQLTPPPPVAPPRPGSPGAAAPAAEQPSPAALAAAWSPLARFSNPGGRPAAALFKPGLVVAERYQLEEKIGQGGMAAVFRATDLELEEQVALKVFSGVEASEVAIARFKQELRLSRQLSHPNIIRLYDIGLYEGHRYISMELLRGRSLKARMAEPFGFHEALRVLEQACLGLQAAHDQGVIHRDVKPDNFFLTEDGVLKVMDFGIAKHQAAPGVTVAGSIAGTPAYMSPEQISNFSTVTHKTDLYALGVMAYEIFTGTQPFAHEELVPLLLLHVNQAPERPRERNPGIPEELDEVILRLLEKDPALRQASAHDVAEDLARIRRSYGG